jgi:hypothetical protein
MKLIRNIHGYAMITVVIGAIVGGIASFAVAKLLASFSRATHYQSQTKDVELLKARISGAVLNMTSCRGFFRSASGAIIPADGTPYSTSLKPDPNSTACTLCPGNYYGKVKVTAMAITIPASTGPLGVTRARLAVTTERVLTDNQVTTDTLNFDFPVLVGITGYAFGPGYVPDNGFRKIPWQCVQAGAEHPKHLLMTTIETYNGNLGGLAGADALCQASMSARGLGGTVWRAILSDAQTDVKDRLLLLGQAVDRFGSVLVNNITEFWDGELPAPGTYFPEYASYGTSWTGSRADGTKASIYCGNGTPNCGSCLNWTSNLAANNGQTNFPQPLASSPYGTANWLSVSSYSLTSCDQAKRLMCFSEWSF